MLQENYGAFDGEIGELVNKIGGLAYQMSDLSSAINTLVSEYGKQGQGINGYTESVAKIVASYSQITDGAAQLVTGSSALKTGSENLYSRIGKPVFSIVEIYDITGTLDDRVAELLSGIAQLFDSTGELKNSTSTMREKTVGMDTEITDKIDELIETVTGGDFEITSFVSEKNTNVQSVQFAIKANGVQMEEASEIMKEAPKKLTVWQKALNLFGLYCED